MSQIQRPTKQGGATTYQGKVGAGYTTILASEMDADLDTIYSAWNSGVDGSNIRPGVITGGMLAPGAVGSRELADGGIQTADLAPGCVTTPIIADGAVTSGKLDPAALSVVPGGSLSVNPRMHLAANPTYADVLANDSGSPGYDVSKSSWIVREDYGSDVFGIFRAAPGSGTYTNPLQLNAQGFLTNHAWGGALNNGSPFGPISSSASNLEVTLPTVWYDNGSGISTANANHLTVPSFPSGIVWCLLTASCDINQNGGFGFDLMMQQFVTGAWQTIRSSLVNASAYTSMQVTALWPIACGTQIRMAITNGTGANVTITWASLQMVVLGQ